LDPYPVSSEFEHKHKDNMLIDKPKKIARQFPNSLRFWKFTYVQRNQGRNLH